MSDIYVEYVVSSTTGSPTVIRIFAKVPRAKIEAYRQAQNDHASSDTDIAYNLSDLPALSRFPHPHWQSSVSYQDALPAELQECESAFEQYGIEVLEDEELAERGAEGTKDSTPPPGQLRMPWLKGLLSVSSHAVISKPDMLLEQLVSAFLCVSRFLQVNWLLQNGAQTYP